MMVILIVFLTSITSLVLLRPIAIKLNLVDYPTDRKKHDGNIPLIGGISIFLAVLTSYFFENEYDDFFIILLIFSSLILIQGVWDDFVNLKAQTKMVFQVLITLLMVYITDIKLLSLGNLFSSSHSIELGIFSIPITIIAVVGLTNSINMIDGVDGLAASIILIAIIGILGFEVENLHLNNILLVLIAAIIPFMIFNLDNFHKMKVFLGDGGSLFLGYMISWTLIYYAENTNYFTPSFALWCVAIPLFDFFSVIIIRITKKNPIMIANEDHIHHFLEILGLSKKLILLIIVCSGLVFLVIGRLIENNYPAISFSIFLTLFFFYLLLRIGISKKELR